MSNVAEPSPIHRAVGRKTPGGSRAIVAVAVLLIVVSHAAFLTIISPVNSDLYVYRRYAAAVARGIADGTSFSVADDENIRDAARRDGVQAPAADAFLIEYPPLAVMWMAAAAVGMDLDTAPGRVDEYEVRYRTATFVLELLLLLVLLRWAAPSLIVSSPGKRLSLSRIGVYGVSALILGNLLFDRLDLVVGALLLLGVVFLVRGWWVASFAVLAVAINFKASPVALAPLWVLASIPLPLFMGLRAHPAPFLRAVAIRSVALVGLAFVVFLPFLIIEGSRAFDFLRLRALQGVHIESVPGTILLVLHEVGLPLRVAFEYGTFEVQTPLSPGLASASPLLLLIAAVAIAVLYVRAATGLDNDTSTRVGAPAAIPFRDRALAAVHPPLFLTATVATIMVTLATSKLLSPQYLLWVLPLVPLMDIGSARTRAFQVWFVIMCLVTTAIFPYLLGRLLARDDPAGNGYLDPTLLGVALLVVRNGLLLWLAWLAVRPLVSPTPTDGSAAVSPGDVTPLTVGTTPGG